MNDAENPKKEITVDKLMIERYAAQNKIRDILQRFCDECNIQMANIESLGLIRHSEGVKGYNKAEWHTVEIKISL